MAQIDTRPPCKSARCKNRAEKGGYCDDHKASRNARHSIYSKLKRDPKKTKVYGSQRWKKKSKRVLSERPLCTVHDAQNKIVAAVLVDHLVGFIDENDPHAWDDNYLFPLCTKCHAIVTAKERYINFLQMPYNEALFVKYGKTDQVEQSEIVHI